MKLSQEHRQQFKDLLRDINEPMAALDFMAEYLAEKIAVYSPSGREDLRLSVESMFSQELTEQLNERT